MFLGMWTDETQKIKLKCMNPLILLYITQTTTNYVDIFFDITGIYLICVLNRFNRILMLIMYIS